MVDKSGLSKDVLKVVKSKTGKSVKEKDIKKLAGTVTPSTLQDEEQLRKLVKQVGSLVNAPVSEEMTNNIVDAVKKSNLNGASLEGLMSVMLGKKK